MAPPTFELLDLGNDTIDQNRRAQGDLQGDYSHRLAYVLGLNAALKF